MGKLVPPVQPGDWKRLRAILNKLNLLRIANYQSSISANDSEISAVSAQAVSNDSEISAISATARSGIGANSSAISVVNTELQSVSSNLVTTDSELQMISAAEIGHADISTFTGLTDTPASYTGKSGNLVKVASAENALEFFSPSYATQSATGALSTAVVTNDSGITAARSGIGANSSAISATAGGGGGVSTFTNLTDTPVSYTGEAGKYAKVDAAESGLVFDSTSGGGGGTDTAGKPKLIVYVSAVDFSVGTANAWSTVAFKGTTLDADSAFNKTNYRWVCPSTGYYDFYSQLIFKNVSPGYLCQLRIQNNTSATTISQLFKNKNTSGYETMATKIIAEISTGDSVSCDVKSEDGDYNILDGSEFSYFTITRAF